MNSIKSRKVQHIKLALDPNSQTRADLFGNYLLPYKALPEINLADVSTEVTLLNKKVSQPLIISSMTGGSEKSKIINTNLAIACEEMKVAFGVGSMRAALESPDAVIKELQDWQKGLQIALFSIGAKNWEQASKMSLYRSSE